MHRSESVSVGAIGQLGPELYKLADQAWAQAFGAQEQSIGGRLDGPQACIKGGPDEMYLGIQT